MGAYYGALKDEDRRHMKDNGKIEEVILKFATIATSTLKKDSNLQGDQWKTKLDEQIPVFVRFLRDCLRLSSHVSPELTQRLDVYTAKLTPKQQSGKTYSDSGYDSSSTNRDRDLVTSPNGISRNIVDMPLVLTVTKLFRLSEGPLQQEVEKISKFCTQKVDRAYSCVWSTLTDDSPDRQP